MASVTKIECRDDGTPEFVTVRMCVEEAVFLSMQAGKISPSAANEILPMVGAAANEGLHEAVYDQFISRYWDDENEALRSV